MSAFRAALEAAGTNADVIAATWRAVDGEGAPLTPEELAEWHPECPEAARIEAAEQLRALARIVAPDAGESLIRVCDFWQYDKRLLATMPGEIARDGSRFITMVGAVALARAWLVTQDRDPDGCPAFPLAPIVRAWMVDPGNAKVRVVVGLTRRAYEVSDVIRTAWRKEGTVAAVAIDGEPVTALVDRMDFVQGMDPERQRRARKQAWVYKTANAGEDVQPTLKGLGGYGTRHPLSLPVPLLAYRAVLPEDGHWVADDVATLIEVAHLGPRLRFETVDKLAYLLSRTRAGGFRPPNAADKQRALNAVGASMFMVVWVLRGGLHWPVRLADVDTNPKTGEVWLAPPAWARQRTEGGEGRWTLTGAQSALAQRSRMAGDSGRATVRRIVTGIEYWLTRTLPRGSGGTAAALIPASGKAGPGPWYELKMAEWLRIAGEIVPDGPMTGATREKARRRREAMTAAGYLVDVNGKPIGGGDRALDAATDTIEVRFTHGRVYVRATERLTAAAAAAKAGRWETIPFGEYIGRPRIFGPGGKTDT